ncbi:hypothetical protein LNP74_24045 [Klebsiella pneumoniae subsp. pneumoniae]|nr:hypothetical protein [Klebsiella pneumoniae subsp. pneumoniae]
MEQERTRYGLEIPALEPDPYYSLHKQVPALKDFPKEDPTLFARRLLVVSACMVAMGVVDDAALGSAAALAALSAAAVPLASLPVVCAPVWGPPVLLPRSPGGVTTEMGAASRG